MVLYNWKRILKESKKPSDIINIFEMLTYKTLPYNRKHRHYKFSTKNFKGQDFMIHPERLFENRRLFKDKDIAEYIGLCSFRSLNNYLITDDTHLEYDFCPISWKVLKSNQLLLLKSDGIYFYYED